MAGTGSGGNGLDGIGRGGVGNTITGINVTPLVDVVLVLLVVLMVSSTYVVAQTIKVQLPKASQSDGPAKKPLRLILKTDGTLMLNDAVVTLDQVSEALTARIKTDPETSLVISADKTVPYGKVVTLIDRAKAAGVTQFAINVELGTQ